jgi:hypothetical protein
MTQEESSALILGIYFFGALNSMQKDSNYLRQVREQYENYPYPYRNPEDEKRKFAD